jgi:hypothetical protein
MAKNPKYPRTHYPGAVDNRDPLSANYVAALKIKQNHVDPYDAEDVNALGDAVLALQETLGVNPQGTRASVRARLDVALNADGTLKSTPPNGQVLTGAANFGSVDGRTVTHNVGNTNYRVLITPTADPGGYLGEWWVLKQANTFVVYNSGAATTAFDWEVRF